MPQGASRHALLSALEQANATIRQLNLDLSAAARCGPANDMGRQCDQLEEEQRELVRAFDELGRVNSSLRKQVRQQGAEVSQLRREVSQLQEALQRRERDWQQRERERAVHRAAATDGIGRLSRTLSKPLSKPLARLGKMAAPARPPRTSVEGEAVV